MFKTSKNTAAALFTAIASGSTATMLWQLNDCETRRLDYENQKKREGFQKVNVGEQVVSSPYCLNGNPVLFKRVEPVYLWVDKEGNKKSYVPPCRF